MDESDITTTDGIGSTIAYYRDATTGEFREQNYTTNFYVMFDSDIYTIDLERCYYGFRCYVNSVEPTDRSISHDYNGIIRYVHELQHAIRLCGIDKEIVL